MPEQHSYRPWAINCDYLLNGFFLPPEGAREGTNPRSGLHFVNVRCNLGKSTIPINLEESIVSIATPLFRV
jgi:hypothetical protein